MTNNDTNRPAPADQDWFGGRRWTGIAAVGVVILIALCVVIVVVLNHHGGGKTASTPPSTSAQATISASASTSSSPAAALPTAVPTKAPTGTTWTIYATLALPSVPGAGPSKVQGSIATGYAHTPYGALLAVINEGERYVLAPDSEWRNAAEAMLAPGAGANAWVKVRAKNLYGPAGAAGSDTLLQVAGFQFVSYTPTDAVVQVANGNANDGYQVASEHVTWLNGDWKFVPATDGSQASNQQQVSSLAGFIPWQGV